MRTSSSMAIWTCTGWISLLIKIREKLINSIIKIEYSVIKGDVFFDLVEACEYLIVIETLLGWLLMALFLVTLSRVMLR